MIRFLFLTLLCFPLFAQDPALPAPAEPEPLPVAEDPGTVAPLPAIEADQDQLISLSALLDSIRLKEQEKAELVAEMSSTVDPSRKERLLGNLNELNRSLDNLRHQFSTIAIQADASLFEEAPKEDFDWQKELGKLLEPLLAELENATKESRELGQLNQQLELNKEREKVANLALENLKPLSEIAGDPQLKTELQELQTTWESRLRDARNQITVLQNQLEEKEKERASPIEEARAKASGFVNTKGLNLLLGVVAFAAVFFGMRALQEGIRKIKPSKKKGKSFSSRLTTLLWTLFTVLASIGAMLATFNARGDWFLLSLSLLFLIGVGWGAMKTLPAFIEQFRMMLNMGSVREDERLVYEGLPWKVNAISFRTELVNPLLEGGVLHLPTQMLVGLLSRPPGKSEEWFPSRPGDWVLLSDETYGRISYQTPSSVQITSPGGSQRVIPSTQYLELSPTVLSTGFRREIFFGLEHTLLKEIITGLPSLAETHVRAALEEKLGDKVTYVETVLSEVTDTRLNLRVRVDVNGEGASSWGDIPAWVQQALVALGTSEGWNIPIPQLRIHSDTSST